MTKEELANQLDGIVAKNPKSDWSKYQRNIVDKAIKMLKESSEDCISRKVVDQNIYDYAESNGLSYANLKNAILDAPSVTPTRKKGKWIRVGSGSLIDDFRCDCCNKQPSLKKVGYTWGWDFTNYCPNCGAEME